MPMPLAIQLLNKHASNDLQPLFIIEVGLKVIKGWQVPLSPTSS